MKKDYTPEQELLFLFDESTSIFDHVDADLTIEGLAILAERVAK